MSEKTVVEAEVTDVNHYMSHKDMIAVRLPHSVRGDTIGAKLGKIVGRIWVFDGRPILKLIVDRSMRLKRGDKIEYKVEKK